MDLTISDASNDTAALTFPTFKEIYLKLRDTSQINAIICLAHGTDDVQCAALDIQDLKKLAHSIPSAGECLWKHVWEIICCLTCAEHFEAENIEQQGRKIRYRIRSQWRHNELQELPDEGMTRNIYFKQSASRRRASAGPSSSPSSSKKRKSSSGHPVDDWPRIPVSSLDIHQYASMAAAQSAPTLLSPNTRPSSDRPRSHSHGEAGGAVGADRGRDESSSPSRSEDGMRARSQADQHISSSRDQQPVGGSSLTIVAGDASSVPSPGILEAVRDLLLEPLVSVKKVGSLYAFQLRSDGPPMVKIGYTMQKLSKRKKQLEDLHKCEFTDKPFRVMLPFVELVRLEQLVHADLAHFQRGVKDSRRRIHREWFEIDIALAAETITLWRDVMKVSGIQTQGSPTDQYEMLLRDHTLLEQTIRECVSRGESSYSHAETLKKWRHVFGLPASLSQPPAWRTMLDRLAVGVAVTAGFIMAIAVATAFFDSLLSQGLSFRSALAHTLCLLATAFVAARFSNSRTSS